MLAPLDPEQLDRIEFPLGELTKAETRAEAARPASTSPSAARARRRASSPATTTARSWNAVGSSRPRARSSTRTAASSAATTASGATRPASGAASASPRPSRCTRCARTLRTNTLVVGPRGSLAAPRSRCAACCTSRSSGRTRSSATARQRSRRAFAPGGRIRPGARAAGYGVAPGQIAALYDEDGAVVGCGVVSSAARLGSAGAAPCGHRRRRRQATPSPRFSSLWGPASPTRSCAWAEPSGAFPR